MNIPEVLVGVDIGTSATKVSAFTLDGQELFSATREYPLVTVGPSQVEQDPNVWWQATCHTLRELTSALSDTQVIGVGIAGQSWASVFLSDEGDVLANSPLWMDTRAREVATRRVEEIGAEEIFATSGNPFAPTYTTPKVLWFQENRPEIIAQTRWVLQSNSFIAYRLTGAATQDLSQTYGLQFADIRTGEYNLDLAEKLGVDVGLFPVAVPCDSVVGSVTDQAAAATGLPVGTPVVAGGLDAACGALGTGVFEPAQCQEQGGQAGGISVATGELIVDPRLICSHHVVPGLWLLQGGTAAGGAALRWAAAEIGEPEASFKKLDESAELVPAGSGGLIFLPYLAGERSPVWNPDAKGVFFGLTFATTRATLLRSVMEGVAFSLRDNIDVMEESGARLGEIYSIGGASQSRLWTQIKADVIDRDISVPKTTSATTLGAAMLAGVGVGAYADYAEAVARTLVHGRTHKPNPGNVATYDHQFKIYRELYRALAPLMEEQKAEADD